jgi:hypothetical protein
MAKKSNLEVLIEGYLKSTKVTLSDLQRSRRLLNNAILNPCCEDNEAILGIAGPTGSIGSGTAPYPVHITSSVTGVPDSEVQNITLYINNVFVSTQDGNDFVYDTTMTAQTPAVEQVYYTVAVLQNGQTIVSPVLQFTLTNAVPTWSFLFQQQIAQTSQTRHIVDRVSDVNLDTLTVSAIGLPSFCTMSLIPVTGVPGQSSVVVDITVSPGGGDAGTYNFTLRANDGSGNVDKAVSLVVDANTHQRHTVRPATNQSISVTAPIGTALGTITATSAMNGVQLDTVPQPVLVNYNTPSGTTTNLVTVIAVPSGPGKQIILCQTRNATTGTGNRNEDAFYIILTIS